MEMSSDKPERLSGGLSSDAATTKSLLCSTTSPSCSLTAEMEPAPLVEGEGVHVSAGPSDLTGRPQHSPATPECPRKAGGEEPTLRIRSMDQRCWVDLMELWMFRDLLWSLASRDLKLR